MRVSATRTESDAARLNFIGGAAVGAAAGIGLSLALRRGYKGMATLRLVFAVAVGVGAYWQEKRRARELARHLRLSGIPVNPK